MASTVGTTPGSGKGKGPVIATADASGKVTVKSVQFRDIKKARVDVDLGDQQVLKDTLTSIQDNIERATIDARHNPLLQGTLTEKIAFTAGGTQMVNHRLGKAYTGWICVYASGGYPNFQEGTLSTGLTSSQVLPLLCQNAGTYRFWVF